MQIFTSVLYLGHVVSADEADPDKLEAIRNMAYSHDATDVRLVPVCLATIEVYR